ncbi:MAG: VacJ family lipoprotein [Rhodospirillales bacterium]|nr:VacJ family lipoprotein [Alphaproteobacteria bacterium]MBL6947216.1 VacJ family lipoprotein [Rhodospirillales bacterium]
MRKIFRLFPRFRVGLFVPAAALVIALFSGAGCAVVPPASDPEAFAEFREVNDPAEPLNRAIFEFNRGLDTAFLKPVAKAYRDILPPFVQDRFKHALANLRSPIIFINDLLQGELDRAIATLVRFMINSTWGLLGLNDLATDMGMEGHDEDFGQTLAVWGAGEGPYLMLPLFGPSNPRDTIGLVVDYLINPFNLWAANTDRDFAVFARTGTRAVDMRATHMEALDDLEKSSLDFYASIRSLYRQRRLGEVSNGDPSANSPAPGLSQAPRQ